MNPITFEAMVEMAERLKADGTPWHFHMTGPKCRLVRPDTAYALILENEANGLVFECRFSDRPASQTHQMALLCYGAGFFKKDKITTPLHATEGTSPNPDFQDIMEKARRCRADGTAWHNHHLPPECMFNPKPGSHCIVFEEETRGDIL